MGAVDKHGNDALAKLQTGLDFNSYEVLRIVEPSAAALIGSVDPALTDDCKHDVTLRNVVFKHTYKILTWSDAINIHEELLWLEGTFQAIEQSSSETRIVATPIVDKDFCSHTTP